jgi:hypothetical protein
VTSTSGGVVPLLPRQSVWRLPIDRHDRPRTLRGCERRDPTRGGFRRVRREPERGRRAIAGRSGNRNPDWRRQQRLDTAAAAVLHDGSPRSFSTAVRTTVRHDGSATVRHEGSAAIRHGRSAAISTEVLDGRSHDDSPHSAIAATR